MNEKKYLQIAIYPAPLSKDVLTKWEEYIKMASQNGVSEVFTSIHLPELDRDVQIEAAEALNVLTKKYDLEFTVDIGGNYLSHYLNDPYYCIRLANMHLDFLRVDYGASVADFIGLKEKWNVKGLVINASIYNQQQLSEFVNQARELNLQVRACHNFYPQENTGLSENFFLAQNNILKKLAVPVYTCIANKEYARGPLYQGLVSLEAHRNMNFEQVVYDCFYRYDIDGIQLGDSYFPEELLKIANKAANDEEIDVKVELCEGITEQEKSILLEKAHQIRYDSNEILLRSETSREMSQFAQNIEANNTVERKRLSIVIDNVLYKRYSGELQVVLKDLPSDERVNVIGKVKEEESYKLAYFRSKVKYRFIEK